MKHRSLTTAITLAAVLGFGVSLTAHATSHMMPGKPAGAMMKDGGEKGGKGGKDKMSGSAMMKEGGDKGGKGGKDKMKGAAMMKDGGDKGGKGGKDKMKGSAMMKDGGEKGGKDKIIGPSDSRSGMKQGSQMRDMGR